MQHDKAQAIPQGYIYTRHDYEFGWVDKYPSDFHLGYSCEKRSSFVEKKNENASTKGRASSCTPQAHFHSAAKCAHSNI